MLDHAINEVFNEKMKALNISNIAQITAINFENQTLSARLVTRRALKTGGFEENQIIQNIPFRTEQGGGFAVTVPIKIGDFCEIRTQRDSLDNWRRDGKENQEGDNRRFDLANSIAYCGISHDNQNIINYSQDSIQVRNAAGDVYLDVAESEIELKTANASIKIDGQGNIAMSNAACSMTLTSGGFVAFTGLGMTFNGDGMSLGADGMTIKGNVLAAGIIDAEQGFNTPAYVTAKDGKFQAADFNSHIHPNGNNGNPTGGPQ